LMNRRSASQDRFCKALRSRMSVKRSGGSALLNVRSALRWFLQREPAQHIIILDGYGYLVLFLESDLAFFVIGS
ncbi:MAG: hypothetical protein HW389_3707, partial [Bacteroidetes bacterium]|nr:hypothetical protein [Bacteroidota bacterium]